MRRVVFLFVLLLFIPQPMTQLVVNSLVEPSSVTAEESFVIDYNPETDYIIEDTIIRITPITEEEYDLSTSKNSPGLPHLSPAIYPSLTEVTGNGSLLHRGDNVDASAISEYELLGYVPVDRGYHYWYDLQEIAGDSDQSSSTISANKIAIEFSSSIDFDLMALSFNLSDIITPISGEIDFYLTDDLSNYLSDYLMYSEISFHTYNSQKNNLDSPLLFTFWNHPLTTPISNSISADTPYYVVLESSADFILQTSSDLSGSDENQVFTYESSSWTEQIDIDIDMEFYTGSLTQSSSLGAGGSSSLFYDSGATTGVNHKLVVNYYDSSLLYDGSSDFLDIIILDSFNPEFIYLTSPPTAEYGDEIQILARVENSHHQPLQGELVDFYISDDNQTWTLYDQSVSQTDGYAAAPYTVTEASGTKYFKVVLDLLSSYGSTDFDKETIIVTAPQINCVYGSAVGSHNLALFQLAVLIQDNEGNPIVDQIVIFFMQGSLDPIFSYTNETGWATTANGYISWNSGFYTNSFWVSLSMDSNHYIYPSTTYGDINILKSTLTILSEGFLQSVWNEPLDIQFSFLDAEEDYIPNLNHEVIIYNNKTDQNTSLGLYQTDSNGNSTISFIAAFLEPGDYVVIIKVNYQNYVYIEKAIPLAINSDKADVSINIGTNVTYVYGSTVHLEMYVVDHLGNPLENIQVFVHVSMPNFIDFWEDIHIVITNSTGYAELDLVLNMEAGDILNILINTADYFVGDILYYEGADSFVSFFNCDPTSSYFEGLSDISCINQETITITGRLMTAGVPIISQAVSITILGETFLVITDANGYFSLTYHLSQGGDIPVYIVFDSSDNYLPVSQTIYLYCNPSSITLTGADIYHTTADPVTIVINLNTPFGTAPQGVAVDIYWFDGNSWIYIDTVYSDENGIATYVSGIVFPLGSFLWKAKVETSLDWLESEVSHILQIGIGTDITIYSPASAEYQDTITLTAYITDEYGNPLLVEAYFYVDGLFIGSALTDISGYATLDWYVNLSPSDYQITVHMLDTGMYLASSSSSSITIEKTASYISCDDEFMFYSETSSLEINLYSASSNISTAYVNVNITGILDEQILSNGQGLALWFIPLLEPGVYTVRIYFLGNGLYYGSELFITLQVDKMPTTVNFVAPNQDYLPIYEVFGYVEDSFNQPIEGVELVLTIDGIVIDTTTSDVFGYFEFQVNLLPGVYDIEVSYAGDAHYLSSNSQKTIHIWEIETSIQTDVVWEDLTVTVEALLLDVNGQPISDQLIFVYLDGVYMDHAVTNSSGYVHFVLNGIIPGTYVLEISYSGTIIYSSSSQTVVIDQDKLQSEMSVTITEGIYGTVTTTIEVYLTSEGTALSGQSINLIINGEFYSGITNGTGYLLISLNLYTDAGDYTISIDYLGDEIYSAVNIGTTFHISKAESQITLQFGYQNYLPVLIGTLTTPIILEGAEILIYESSFLLDTVTTNSLGEFKFNLLLLSGVYQLEVEFEGDDNHLGFIKVIQVDIFKTTIQIDSPSHFNQTYGEETSFQIYVEDVLGHPLSVTIIVKIDGAYYATITTNSSGYGTLTLTADIEAGIHTLTLEFQGDDNYYQTSQNLLLYTKYEVILDDFQTSPGDYGDEGQITGIIDNYSGNLPIVEVVLILDGETYIALIEPSGNFMFIIDADLLTGTYSATISIEETDRVIFFEYSFSIVRSKGSATITVDDNPRTFNDNSNVQGYIMFDGIGLEGIVVVIYVDGVEMGTVVTDETGLFIISVEWLEHPPGDYILTLTALISDPNIDVTIAGFSLEILKDEVTLEITYENTKIEQELQLNFKLVNSQLDILYYYSFELEINGTVYPLITDEAGTAQFLMFLDEVGVLYLLVSGADTTYYNSFSNAFEIEIEKTKTIIELEEAQIPFNDSKGLSVSLESEFGNTLANYQLLVVINSSTYNLITDDNGTVFIDIDDIPLGIHSVFIDFAGSTNYHGVKLYAYIEIIPQETQLLIINEDNVPYLLLLDSEGRPLILRDVTFKYYHSNETVLATEDLRTDMDGKIILDHSSITTVDDAEELYVSFKGEKYYAACDIWLIVSDILIKLQQSLDDPAFWTYTTVGLVGVAALFGFRHFLKKRKI